MKLNYITFMVRDIEKSLAFYQDLVGLKIVNRINPGAGEIVFLANEKDETKGMVMSFLAKTSLEELKEKATTLDYSPSEIIAKGPKPKHFTVMDPDEIVVEFSI